jgi:hypothetical protein
MDPSEFVKAMEAAGQNRLYAVFDPATKDVKISHPAFSELRDFFANDKIDYKVRGKTFLSPM